MPFLVNLLIFNCGYENHTVSEIAAIVKNIIDKDRILIETTTSDDNRSYSISSARIKEALGFVPRLTIEQAVKDLKQAFDAHRIQDPFNNIRYYNIKTMKQSNLQ